MCCFDLEAVNCIMYILRVFLFVFNLCVSVSHLSSLQMKPERQSRFDQNVFTVQK